MTLTDLTMPIAAGMPFNPDHFPPEITPYADLPTHGWRASKLVLDSHLGTHIDAPHHFIEGGETVDALDLAVLIGAAQIVHLTGIGECAAITLDHLPPVQHPRLLLHTGWSERAFDDLTYFSAYPYLTVDAARALAEQGVRLVGIDCPSVDYDPGDTHRALLGRGVIIIENLVNLARLPTFCTVMALPLPIRRGDGSPARIVAQY